MAQTDVEKLVVSIEARTADFERQLRRLERKTDSSMRNNARAVNRLDRSLKMAGASAANFMATFARGAGAAALAALPYTVGQAVSAVADLGNAANRAGVSAEGLQVFRRALEQNGASARDADDAMRRFTRRLGEFANSGGGPAKAAIEALRLEVFNLDGSLRRSEDVLFDVADQFARIESPAQQAAFAAQLFGDDAGPRLVPLLSQGSQALAGFRRDLEDTGALIRDDAVQAAIEMEDAYNRLMDNVAARWQRGVVQIAGYARDLISITQEATRSAVDSLNAAFEASRSPEQLMRGALGNYEFQSRNGLETGSANFFDRSSFRMPGASDDTQAPIVDPRHSRALEELRGLLAATDATAQRVSASFEQFEVAGTEAARNVGGAVREATGEPLDLMENRVNDIGHQFSGLGNTASGFLQDIRDGFMSGANAADTFRSAGLNALTQISDMLIQTLIPNLFRMQSGFAGIGGGGGGGLLSGLLGSFFPSFAGGGYTGNGSRSGGLDGMGGFPAILHPKETVTDHTRAGGAGGGSVAIYQTNYISNPFGMEGVARAIQEGNARAVGQATNASVAKVSNIQRRTARPLG